MPVERLVFDKRTGTKFGRRTNKVFVGGVGMELLRPIEGMDVARSALLINDGIASGVARWRAIEKTVGAERKKK